MKYFNPLLAIILWIVILCTSWYIYQGSTSRSYQVSWEFHARLQKGLQEFVVNHIKENLPSATNIQFLSLWSELINDDEIKVFFEYQFQHPSEEQLTSSKLKGWALLNPASENPQESWTIKKVSIDQESIEYEPEVITF